MSVTPEERRARAQKAAAARWARPTARDEAAEAARAALRRRFEAAVDPDGVLPVHEREEALREAATAHMAKMRASRELSKKPFTMVLFVERDAGDDFFVPSSTWLPAPFGRWLVVRRG